MFVLALKRGVFVTMRGRVVAVNIAELTRLLPRESGKRSRSRLALGDSLLSVVGRIVLAAVS
jgi:hypothetical protein